MIGALSLAAVMAVLGPSPWRPASIAAMATCDSWTWRTSSLVRFRATLRQIAPFGAAEIPAGLVGRDGQRYVVTLAVESVEPNPLVQQGNVLRLAIHSLEESFGAVSGDAVGATMDLELVAEYCDGWFWRFMLLRPRSPAAPRDFIGDLALDGTYRVQVEWDPEAKETVFRPQLQVPYHYQGEVDLLNPEVVKTVGPGLPPALWVLEVRSVETEYLGGNLYQITYKCVLLSQEPCSSCPTGDQMQDQGARPEPPGPGRP